MAVRQPGRLGWALVAFGLALRASAGHAVYLDPEQNISLRARMYSQASVRTENSQKGTVPTAKAGQLVQHRNFFNPELDARLASYLSWMNRARLGWLAPEDFRFRLAAWGFYDGIYDYGSSQFNRSARKINANFPDLTRRTGAFYLEGPDFNRNATTVDDIFADRHVQNPRDIYGKQRRINELYLSYAKGPLFVRIGKQMISWGESDTIALLDANNPFDATLGAPGIFQDLEEARIPLWTIRASYNLFEALGPFSSGFVEAYWVPGDVDTNTGYLPLLTASPYSPRGTDPQTRIPPILPIQFVLLDHVPDRKTSNSRWGVRGQTVIGRTHTVSLWYYTHFPNAPVPRAGGLVRTTSGVQIATTETVHELTAVTGVSDAFFVEGVDGIVRLEAEYFDNEPAFTPERNLGITETASPIDIFGFVGKVPKADYLRWEIGFDRFFFIRPLNPTTSFTFISSLVGAWNLSETAQKDFRAQGQFKESFFAKPATTAPRPNDFVQSDRVEVFVQTTLQTTYMHGRITPRLTAIGHSRGTYLLAPAVEYRFADWLLFNLALVHIDGDYQGFGFFRDRDQISARVTYQLN